MLKRLWGLTGVACLVLVACAASPSASALPTPLLTTPETVTPTPAQGAQITPSTSATPTPTALVTLVVEPENDADLFARLSQADAEANLPRSFRSTFRLRQRAALADTSAKSSLDIESARLSSGDLRVTAIERTEEAGQISLIAQEFVKLKNVVYYTIITETLSQREALCTQIFDSTVSEAVLANAPSAERFGAIMLSDVFSFTLVARGVSVNNFRADQYDFLTELSEQSGDGTGLDYYSSGSVWFARDLWTVVRHEGRFKGMLRLLEDENNKPLQGEFTWVYELTPPDNQPIVPPSACDLSKQWQVTEGALLAIWSGDSAILSVRSTSEALVAHYEKALEERGWTKRYLEKNSSTLTSLVYDLEDKETVVMLQEDGQSDNVFVYIVTKNRE